jgi:2-C-methyl-D-erythritol 4-phosphate cytidylyltransferase
MAYWAVVPAAGSGKRMSSQVPKQYLALAGKTVIEHALTRLSAHPLIDGIVVALAPGDTRWPDVPLNLGKPVLLAEGGGERCYSVLNALFELQKHAQADDWVLVHDGARPCLRLTDIDKLIAGLRDHPHGGLLAVPVRDTMKRADENSDVFETVDRKGLWHALTPQMFRLGELSDALIRAIDKGWLVTDEASAMERAGYKPHLVEGAADNIKITRPEDLVVAEFYLHQQERGG